MAQAPRDASSRDEAATRRAGDTGTPTRSTSARSTAARGASARSTSARGTTARRATRAASTDMAPGATSGTAASGDPAASGATPSTRPVHAPGRRQQKTGRVVSDKMQKTIVVAVELVKRHRIYKRTFRSTARYKVHDEHDSARVGDMVRIEETRPLSKEKRWRLLEILKRAEQTRPVEEVVAALEP